MIKKIKEVKPFDLVFRHKRIQKNIRKYLPRYNSVLYVGGKAESLGHINIFENYNIDILEIWRDNVVYLRNVLSAEQDPDRALFENRVLDNNVLFLRQQRDKVKVIEGDILSYKSDLQYDISMWWHGPEHVSQENIEQAIKNLENLTRHIVILGCPWGHYDQEDVGGNKYEIHLSHNKPRFFANLGYDVECHGREGEGSNLLCIKYL